MKVKVYRNLDRPFTLFGIKGSFIGVMMAIAVIALIVASAIGSATSGFIVSFNDKDRYDHFGNEVGSVRSRSF